MKYLKSFTDLKESYTDFLRKKVLKLESNKTGHCSGDGGPVGHCAGKKEEDIEKEDNVE